MTEVWGLLAKSQTDDTTIDEAVDAKIAIHEADADSHLDVGESLQSHKASVIIDHVLGSVLFDKLSNTEMLLNTNFDSLDRWTLDGAEYSTDWPGVTLYCTNVTDTVSRLYTVATGRAGSIDGAKDSFFQTTIRLAEEYNKLAFFGNCFNSGETILSGYGFKIVNLTVYGFWVTHAGVETVELAGVDSLNFNVFRAQYVASTRTVTFYVNGTVAGSIVHADYLMDNDFIICFFLKTKTTQEASMDITNLLVSAQI